MITISTAPLASLALRRSELMAPVARRRAAPPCLVATFQSYTDARRRQPPHTRNPQKPTCDAFRTDSYGRKTTGRRTRENGAMPGVFFCANAPSWRVSGRWWWERGREGKKSTESWVSVLGETCFGGVRLRGPPGVVAFGSKNHTLIHNTFVPECIFLFGAKTCFALTMR